MSELLGVMFALLVGLVMVPGFIRYEQTGISNTKIAATAAQLKQVSDATQQYVQANAIAIEAVATATSPATITVPMLQATGYLMSAVSAVNPYGQTWQAQVLQPSPGRLQVLVMPYGGVPVQANMLPKLASLAGQQGGFTPYAGQYGGGTCSIVGSPCVMGSYGGWQVSMANYANPGSGYVGALLYFNNGNLANNYLYRNAVPGNPSLNTMNTPLIMAATGTSGQACPTTGAVAQDGTGLLLSCQSGKWGYQIQPIQITINANTNNYNLFAAAGSPSQAVKVFVTISAGVSVGSTSTSLYAFDTGLFASGSSISITNNGNIIGKGGDGGAGIWPGSPYGSNGGPALLVSSPITLTNNGVIAGGGGGGGGTGTGDIGYWQLSSEGGGGGAGGINPGAGGLHGCVGGFSCYGGPGAAGSYWLGGAGATTTWTWGNGGAGGPLGTAGATSAGPLGYYPGGAGGTAIYGNGNISWVTHGIVAGAVY